MPESKLTKILLNVGIPVTAVVVTAAGFLMLLSDRDEKIDTLHTMLRVQSEAAAATTAPEPYEPLKAQEVNRFYELAGHKILLYDKEYGEIYIPQLKDVPLSVHPLEQIKDIGNGRVLSYGTDGKLNALTGIDISQHNEVTDWDAVKAAGVDFVMLRVGVRTYGGGELRKDTCFQRYYDGAKKAGLKVGAYFFSQAVTEAEAVEEARLTAQVIGDRKLDYPVAYDWEIIYDDEARTDDIPVDTLTDCTIAFCENMKHYGFQPMIYQNKRTSLLKLDLPRLQEYPFWLAEYSDGATYPYDYDMWQYSPKGSVPGIVGKVDLNISFYDYAQENAPAVSLDIPPDLTAIGTMPKNGSPETVLTDEFGNGLTTETTAMLGDMMQGE
ncbi:MAG: glycoside hydrolase family 25 protein [Oscillospiraceae bacterium]|nr:glycoside hydrolase family 25 protein [Oscillospiraceae bacterium]